MGGLCTGKRCDKNRKYLAEQQCCGGTVISSASTSPTISRTQSHENLPIIEDETTYNLTLVNIGMLNI